MSGQSERVIAELKSMVSDRILPPEIITKTVVLALGALWVHRMFPNPLHRELRRRTLVESLIIVHILEIFRALIDISIRQLTDADGSPRDSSLDLAQFISAVMRRMLPSLRICAKWLTVNLDTVCGPSAPSAIEVQGTIAKLWDAYSGFSSLLLRVFSPNDLRKLRPMRAPLDEDVDLSGFAPLKNAMLEHIHNPASGEILASNDVHPNDEQLMRVRDFIADAKTIAADEVKTNGVATTVAHLIIYSPLHSHLMVKILLCRLPDCLCCPPFQWTHLLSVR